MHWKDKIFEVLDRNLLMELAAYDTAPRRPRPFI